jgi:hypothetical protein
MQEDLAEARTPRPTGTEVGAARGASSGDGTASAATQGTGSAASGGIVEIVFSPFHCLYQDALHFHTQSQLWLVRSEAESSRLARAAFLLYLSSAEALAHQAALELGRPELTSLLADPGRPLPLGDAWRLLPAIVAAGSGPAGPFDPELAPWPQFGELLALRSSWAYPGPAAARRAYYLAPRPGAPFEPMEPHQIPPELGLAPDAIQLPRTGLPRDPYALRPRHLDVARSVLDAAIAALDRHMDGALCRDQRHRREPLRQVGAGSHDPAVAPAAGPACPVEN